MHKTVVYTVGGITGLSWEQATEWREQVAWALGENFICHSPLRGKSYLSQETSIKDSYSEHIKSSQRGIFARDTFDVLRADALFVNLLGAPRVSIGSVMEITLAWYLRKQIVIVMESDNIHQHAMLRETTPWIVTSLDDGVELLRDIFY